jgi:hypothetical protein
MEGINMRLLRLELDRQLEKQADETFNKIKPQIKKKFNQAKEELLEAFDENPITQEILEGPGASSEYVSTRAGGNLFSLIGFENGEEPTEELREILEQSITLQIQDTRRKKTSTGIAWEVPVNIPSLSEIDKKTASRNPLEWTSRGWTYLIEKGIPWFAHYLFDDIQKRRTLKNSRSGTAIQVKGTISEGRESSFQGIPYLSELIRNFQKSIK